MTDRPKTDRKKSAFNQQMFKLENLEGLGKKYLRTSQLTTSRNRGACVGLETKHTNSTLQCSNSPKSIEQS